MLSNYKKIGTQLSDAINVTADRLVNKHTFPFYAYLIMDV